jgi:hypothetical protein
MASKRINVLKTFNFEWPDRSAVTHVSATGPILVKEEIADYAIAKGLATPIGEPKSGTRPRRTATRGRAKTTHTRGTAGVDPADLPRPGGSAHGRSVGPDAG